MHILFAHKNFPAQFRYIMPHLVQQHGIRCSFVSSVAAATVSDRIQLIKYTPRATASRFSSYCGRSFEDQMWASQAVVEALAARADLRPDLVVAHSGFFTSSFLRELYDCPVVNLFEYFYWPTESECDFRVDLFQPELIQRVRTRARNSSFLLDLQSCDRGYCPTQWQKSRFPQEFQHKLSVIHDGVDTEFWSPRDSGIASREFGIPDETKVVTYVTRGFESMRGFDIFMKIAKRICDMRNDVVFLVAGSDQVSYGPDRRLTGGKSFKDWVLQQDDYDVERIRFLGYLPKDDLRELYRRSDLHVYLTAPFILSWSPLDAMASGCLVLGSDTGPVQEVVQHNRNGLLCDFFDVDQFVQQANQVFNNPGDYSRLRIAARDTMQLRFGLDVCLPKLAEFYQKIAHANWQTN